MHPLIWKNDINDGIELLSNQMTMYNFVIWNQEKKLKATRLYCTLISRIWISLLTQSSTEIHFRQTRSIYDNCEFKSIHERERCIACQNCWFQCYDVKYGQTAPSGVVHTLRAGWKGTLKYCCLTDLNICNSSEVYWGFSSRLAHFFIAPLKFVALLMKMQMHQQRICWELIFINLSSTELQAMPLRLNQ